VPRCFTESGRPSREGSAQDQLRVWWGKKAGESAGGRDGGIGCGGYFPGDGLAYNGKGKDADDAEGAKDRDDVRKRDTFGHGNVGDGDVEGYARFTSFLDPDGNEFQLIEYATPGLTQT